MLEKLISGGQTGADQGGLEAAELLEIPTGGMMPLGFRTEVGERPDLAERFNLVECASPNYPPRTRYNVMDSQGTIVFGDVTTPGSRLTKRMCREGSKPCLVIEEFDEDSKRLAREFLQMYEIAVLNVAGNRESVTPGIQRDVRNFLLSVLGESDEFAT